MVKKKVIEFWCCYFFDLVYLHLVLCVMDFVSWYATTPFSLRKSIFLAQIWVACIITLNPCITENVVKKDLAVQSCRMSYVQSSQDWKIKMLFNPITLNLAWSSLIKFGKSNNVITYIKIYNVENLNREWRFTIPKWMTFVESFTSLIHHFSHIFHSKYSLFFFRVHQQSETRCSVNYNNFTFKLK